MSLQRRNSRDSTPGSSPAHASMSLSGISPHIPTSDDIRLKSSLKNSHTHTPRSHRVTMDKALTEDEQEWDQDEPDPELFARDRRDHRDRPRIDISPSRRPSESKHRRRQSFRRTCTNKRVAMGTVLIVLIILMIALTIRIRQVPTDGGTITTTTTTTTTGAEEGAGAGIQLQLNVPSTTTACPPHPECPAPAPVAASTCPDCPLCPSVDNSELDRLRNELHSMKMKYDQLQSEQRTQETALQAAQAQITTLKQGIGQQSTSIRVLETATAPPSTGRRLIGAGDPYEVTGEDADIPLESHLVAWNYCLTPNGKLFGTHDLCPNRANSEQGFQLAFYDQWDKNGRVVPLSKRPSYPSCIQRIPQGYVFPPKHRPPLPHKVGVENWGNFGNDITKLEDLIVFNPTALKNLYHFDAARYDHDFEHHIRFGAKFIPLASKVRLALDVGSGGGSFGLWLKQKYDIQTLSIAFPDWPYCEYISMRGNLCMYVDAFHAMPFSKFTFDLVHVSWVYHSMDPPDLEKAFLEVYRITRPGGYMWLQDGHSRAQVETQQRLIKLLGLVKLFEHQLPHKGETSFGNNPYQLQWWTILLKPIREVNYTSNVTACHLP